MTIMTDTGVTDIGVVAMLVFLLATGRGKNISFVLNTMYSL